MPSEADITRAVMHAGFAAGRAAASPREDQSPLPSLVVPLGLIALDAGLGGAVLAALGAGQEPGLLFLILAQIGIARRGLYEAGPGLRVGRQLALAGGAIMASFGATALALLLLRPALPLSIGGGLVLAGLAMLAGRVCAAAVLQGQLGARLVSHAVVIGGGTHAAAVVRASRTGGPVPRLIGRLDDAGANGNTGPAIPGLPCLGSIARLGELCATRRVDEVIVALPWAGERRVLDLTRQLAAYPISIRIAPEPLAAQWPNASVTPLGDLRLLHVLDRPISGWAGFAKRAEDILLGSLLLVGFALPMALLALAVRLDRSGPVLFRQRRIGFENRSFEMLKFRTMHQHGAPPGDLPQATRHDPRVTRLGAFLRRTSLDELPQLFNVLRGEMSLVGPRPHAPGTSAKGRRFEDISPCYAGRHRVKPGITGLAQVRGLRGETRTEDAVRARVAADFEYIQRWSIGLDLAILARTGVCVLTMRNAY